MLFYERRPSPKSSDNATSESSSADDPADAQPSTSCSDAIPNSEAHDKNAAGAVNEGTTIETEPDIELSQRNLETQTKTRHLCDIVSKDRPSVDHIDHSLSEATAVNKQKEAINDGTAIKPSTVFAFNRLNKELEDWIWQDNRHFLQDRNVFEHTYFK